MSDQGSPNTRERTHIWFDVRKYDIDEIYVPLDGELEY